VTILTLAFGSTLERKAPVAEPAFTLHGSMKPTAAIASWFNRFRMRHPVFSKSGGNPMATRLSAGILSIHLGAVKHGAGRDISAMRTKPTDSGLLTTPSMR
jgi:hypothetical protein